MLANLERHTVCHTCTSSKLQNTDSLPFIHKQLSALTVPTELPVIEIPTKKEQSSK